uniref:Uncharacterized protein n=1 Tax=Anguilla anguilla TaxID=7936 RepID=A0A0E9V7M5_ANGAN
MLRGCFASTHPRALIKVNEIPSSSKHQDIIGFNIVSLSRKQNKDSPAHLKIK